LALNRTREERENYIQSRQYLAERLCEPRRPEAEITDEHRDVAAALQACLDSAVLHICGYFGAQTGMRRLAMAGGVALNCTANGKLMRSGLFDDIYIQPAAGDDGTALGAALYRAAQAGEIANHRFPVPFLGPSYPAGEIDAALCEFEDRIQVTRYSCLDETCSAAAALINGGQVVAWYRGRMEYGPRALGHRSIVADPGDPGMRDRLNAMVKMREAFRPFAPAVTLAEVHRWFEVPAGTELPYMIFNVNVREPYRPQLPAVTHVNGTARVQTVDPRDNCEFHSLLQAVGKISGRQMVVNTSFNVKGQPIVNTPREAIETYLNTGIDVLFLEDVQVNRRAG
jgi:carbamoyltransferase